MSLASQLGRVIDGTFVRGYEHHDELGSTNDRARDLPEDVPLPWLIVADRQTAGRGRGANRWWSESGSLTYSLVLDTGSVPIPGSRRSLVALVAGLAVRDAVAEVCPGIEPRLKWPNDVLVGNRKVCGILVEESGGRTVVGMGVNVGGSLSGAPGDVRRRATTLEVECGTKPDRGALLAAMLARIDRELSAFTDPLHRIDRRWSTHCALAGRPVSITSYDRVLIGTCEGIDETGALLVRTEVGLERVLSGNVESRG